MPSNQPESNLTTPDPADAVALPSWEEAHEAVFDGNPTALHLFINTFERSPVWRSMLSEAVAEIRNAERERDRWQTMEMAPRERKNNVCQQIILIAKYPGVEAWSDPVHSWWQKPTALNPDGWWAHWKHPFPPTHWMHAPAPPRLAAPTAEEKK